MSNFEFAFTLFGLLLGLSLAEILGGFGRAIKARERVRIGWLTPMLGILVMLDLTSFWTTAWSARDLVEVNYLTLMLLLIFTGLYYLAASLVFPDDMTSTPELDEHYWRNKRLVIGGVFILNVPDHFFDLWTGLIAPGNLLSDTINVVFFSLLIAALLARSGRTNAILLAALITLYPLHTTLSALKVL